FEKSRPPGQVFRGSARPSFRQLWQLLFYVAQHFPASLTPQPINPASRPFCPDEYGVAVCPNNSTPHRRDGCRSQECLFSSQTDFAFDKCRKGNASFRN